VLCFSYARFAAAEFCPAFAAINHREQKEKYWRATDMGFRSNRWFQILSDIRINSFRSVASAAFGERGAWITVGKKRIRSAAGFRGAGVPYFTTTSRHRVSGNFRYTDASREVRMEYHRKKLRRWMWSVGTLLILAAGALYAYHR
jgi:hypothetical protein